MDAMAFISYDMALEATQRTVVDQSTHPVILGVDVARYGDDSTIIYARQGRDARSRKPLVLQGKDTMTTAAFVMQKMNEWNAAVCMVDGGGVGGGVVDRLMQLGVNVVEVQFGAKADGVNVETQNEKYMNKRAEIWGAMRAWLRKGAIPDELPDRGSERDFATELATPTYTLNAKDHIQLESKEMMKRRGEPSPDLADALACTFALPWHEDTASVSSKPVVVPDYNPLEEGNIYANA
jgi:hypothetical protein